MDNSKWNKFKEHNAETLTELEALKEELDAENKSLEAKASGGADEPKNLADADSGVVASENPADADVPPTSAGEEPPAPAAAKAPADEEAVEDLAPVGEEEDFTLSDIIPAFTLSDGVAPEQMTLFGQYEIPEPTISNESLETIFKESYVPRPLTPDDANYNVIMEHFTSAPTKPKYWFEEFGDYWTCSCGQINQGETCINCGLERSLLRSLFFLHKPDSEGVPYDVPYVPYGGEEYKPAVKEQDVVPSQEKPAAPGHPDKPDLHDQQRKPKGKIIVAILVALIVILAGGAAAYTFLLQPEMEEENAERVTNVSAMLNDAAPDIGKDFKKMTLQAYIDTGDDYYDNWNYTKAMAYYERAQEIENSDMLITKIYDCKYGYVVSHKDSGGDTFERYLEELKAIGYGGEIDEIYDKYYAWHVKIVANRNEGDYETNESSFSRLDTVFMHVTLTGGKPDETIALYYEVTWPSGRSQMEDLGDGWKDGGQITARFQYPVPTIAQEGPLVFKLFDKSTNKVLKKKTIQFVQ